VLCRSRGHGSLARDAIRLAICRKRL